MPNLASLILELPPYLGFGRLDPKSVSTEGNKIVANYTIGDERVYQVALDEKGCSLIEYFDGEEAGRTQHRTLEAAFMHHMMAIPLHESKRFEKLSERITRNRNIYVRLPTENELNVVSFPAGCLFVLRQPVVAGNQSEWNAFKDTLKRRSESAPVELLSEHNGVILRLLESGIVDAERIIVGDCGALLMNLGNAADMMWESGVVPSEKEYRLTIMNIPESYPGGLIVNLGDPTRGFLTFSACVIDNMKTTLEQLSDKFTALSIQLLFSLKR